MGETGRGRGGLLLFFSFELIKTVAMKCFPTCAVVWNVLPRSTKKSTPALAVFPACFCDTVNWAFCTFCIPQLSFKKTWWTLCVRRNEPKITNKAYENWLKYVIIFFFFSLTNAYSKKSEVNKQYSPFGPKKIYAWIFVRKLFLPRGEQFSKSEARGKLWASRIW